MSSLFVDVWIFVRSMVRKLSGYITGGVVVAAVTVYERLTRQTVSIDSLYVGLGAFFVVAAFSAWREQYQAATDLSHPFNLRERLDKIAADGQTIFDQWIAGQSPKRRTGQWVKDAETFVARNLTLTELDRFKAPSYPADSSKRIKISMDMAQHKARESATADALLISAKLDVLSRLRLDITDRSH